MPLYVIRTTLIANDWEIGRPAGEKIIGHIDVALEGARGDDEGTWRIADSLGPFFMGHTKGHWENRKSGEKRSIWLMAGKDDRTISLLWDDSRGPEIIAFIDGILRYPLSLGETGFGELGGWGHRIGWRVLSRSF